MKSLQDILGIEIPKYIQRKVNIRMAISNKIAGLLQSGKYDAEDFMNYMDMNKIEFLEFMSASRDYTLEEIAKIEVYFDIKIFKL